MSPTSDAHLPAVGFSGFVAELRRRHVVKVGIGYAAVVFVGLQMAEIVLPAFLFGRDADAWLRLLVVGSTLFFPVVAVLAWVYEITPQGVRTMRDLDREAGVRSAGHVAPRLGLLAVTVLAAAGAGLGWYRTDVAHTEAAREAWLARQAPPASFAATVPADPADSTDPVGRTDPLVSMSSVVVLPFAEQGPEAAGGWYADAFHEALTTAVGSLGGIRVVSRTTALQREGAGLSLRAVADELGVDAVVEGAVLLMDGKVRITVRLVHAATDAQLWSARYLRTEEDALAVQDEVAAAVVEALGRFRAATEDGPTSQPAAVAIS